MTRQAVLRTRALQNKVFLTVIAFLLLPCFEVQGQNFSENWVVCPTESSLGETVHVEHRIEGTGPGAGPTTVFYEFAKQGPTPQGGLTGTTAAQLVWTHKDMTTTITNLGPGQWVQTQMDLTPPGDGSYTIVPTITAGGVDTEGTPCTIDVVAPVPDEANLALRKEVDKKIASRGEEFTYTVTVENYGPQASPNTMVRDQLHTRFQLSDFSVTQGGCELLFSTLTCNLGTLPVNEYAYIEIRGTIQGAVGNGDLHLNTASVSGDLPDSNPSNNQDLVGNFIYPETSSFAAQDGTATYGNDGDCGDPSDPCTLSDAIQDATDGQGDVIFIDIPTGGPHVLEGDLNVEGDLFFDTYAPPDQIGGVGGTLAVTGYVLIGPSQSLGLGEGLELSVFGQPGILGLGNGASIFGDGSITIDETSDVSITLGDPEGGCDGATPNAVSINNLDINTPNGMVEVRDPCPTDQIQSTLEITGEVRLQDGLVLTGDNILQLPSAGTQGFTRTMGHIVGTVCKPIPGSGRFEYPVGSLEDYRSGILTFDEDPSTTDATVCMNHVDEPPVGTEGFPLGPITGPADFYWLVTSDIGFGAAQTFDLEFLGSGFTDFTDVEDIRIIRRLDGDVSNSWESQGGNYSNFQTGQPSEDPLVRVTETQGGLIAQASLFTFGVNERTSEDASGLIIGTVDQACEDPDKAQAFLYPEPLQEGDVVESFVATEFSTTLAQKIWFGWVDCFPDARFGHEGAFVFIDAGTTGTLGLDQEPDYFIHDVEHQVGGGGYKTSFWPMINGEPYLDAPSDQVTTSDRILGDPPTMTVLDPPGNSISDPTDMPVPNERICALLVSGKGNDENQQAVFNLDLELMKTNLMKEKLGPRLPEGNIEVMENPSKEELKAKIESMENEYDTIYFYYSGHGDGDRDDEGNIRTGGMVLRDDLMSYDDLAFELYFTHAPNLNVILDACQSGSAEGAFRESSFYENTNLTLVASSNASKASYSSADQGWGGVFTQHFLQCFGDPNAEGDGKEGISLEEAYGWLVKQNPETITRERIMKVMVPQLVVHRVATADTPTIEPSGTDLKITPQQAFDDGAQFIIDVAPSIQVDMLDPQIEHLSPGRSWNIKLEGQQNPFAVDLEFHFNPTLDSLPPLSSTTLVPGVARREGPEQPWLPYLPTVWDPDASTITAKGVTGFSEWAIGLIVGASGVAIEEGGTEVPQHYALHASYPNPFNPTTHLRYELPNPSDVRLTIYDVHGRAVKTLVETRQQGGRYTVSWDGRNSAGTRVASGVYFYRLTAGSFVETKRMVLVK